MFQVGHFVAPFAVIGGLMVLSVPLCLAVLPPQLAGDGLTVSLYM